MKSAGVSKDLRSEPIRNDIRPIKRIVDKGYNRLVAVSAATACESSDSTLLGLVEDVNPNFGNSSVFWLGRLKSAFWYPFRNLRKPVCGAVSSCSDGVRAS